MAESRSSYAARPQRGGSYKRRDDRPYGKSRGDRAPRREAVAALDMTLDAPAFAELGLPRPLTCALANAEITEPFPIQSATIPDALAGRDVLGRGKTGSGKTLAFGLPMLTRLMGAKSEPLHPRALILVPTRELAMQVRDALYPLAQQVNLSMQLVIGGASYDRQLEGMRRGADIVVATPGRLIDLVDRRAVDLSSVTIAVLDEADQMADMGFLEEVDQIMQLVQPGGQRLLFSATLDRGVDKLVKNHLSNPVEHATDPETASVTTMTHHLFVVDAREKPAIVHAIAKREGRTICFARTQLGVEQWAGELADMGVRVDALHGGKSQGARNKAITNFKDGKVDVLVATDVAARGIHVDGIDLVLQIDPPRDSKDYLHRAGRTARAGKEGLVVLISTTRQIRSSEQMLREAGVDAIDKRVHLGDPYLAEITGARDEVAPQPRRTHLREEQAVRRAVIEHDDDLSFVDHREARPRTARVDDHRFAPRRDDRPRFEARRVERQAGAHHDRPRFDRDNRGERPAFNRDDRPRFDRDNRGERPAFNRDDRPRFDRDNRGERPAFNRDTRGERPAFNRDDRPRFDRDNRGERPAFNRDTRSERPAFNRDDRPRFDRDNRGERPAFNRDTRSERPAFNRDERPTFGDRPRFDRSERPARDDRPATGDRPRRPAAPTGNRKQTDKPRWSASDRKGRKGR
jgi:superfamily II DNA/RNA helicase